VGGGVGGGGGGVVLALPLPAGLLSVPWPQPLRMRSEDSVRASDFRIMVEASKEIEISKAGLLLIFRRWGA
jgi:hypothetical protein